MPTYSKETALYDTGAIAHDIDTAGDTADTYITAVDQNGIKVHAANNANTNYAGIDATGMDIVRGGTSMAKFGETITLGGSEESHAEIDSDSLQFVDGSGETFFLVNDAVEVSEAASLVEIFESTGSSTDNTLTLQHAPARTPVIYRTDGMPSTITSVSGNVLTLEFALRPGSIAIVPYETTDYHAMNGKTMMLGVNEEVPLATGAYSASVGTENQPSGDKSMTVGSACRTVDSETFASGGACLAAGEASVAHGAFARAVGFASFAQGGYVIAYGPYQHAIGRFNEVDINSNYPFVIGNGTANSNRSNAFAVGWDGTVTTARDILVTSTSEMSGIMTAGSGITVDIFKFCQRSNVASILLRAKKSTVTAANTAITVGTVVADRRPPFECAGPGTSGVGDCWIDETGAVKFRSTSQIAANANFYVRVTYPVA